MGALTQDGGGVGGEARLKKYLTVPFEQKELA